MKFHNVLIATVAASLYAGAAHSADAVVEEPVFTEPVFTWTGFYMGAAIGGIVSSDPVYVRPASTPAPELDFYEDGSASFLGGAYTGFNYQTGNLVLGIEADAEALDFSANDGDEPGILDSIDYDWQASLRARVGYAFDRTMIYATGGFAVMGIEYGLDADAPGGPHSESATVNGYTVGAGVEHALTDQLLVRAEYRFSDFSDERFTFDGNFSNERIADDLQTHTVRLGIAYKF